MNLRTKSGLSVLSMTSVRPNCKRGSWWEQGQPQALGSGLGVLPPSRRQGSLPAGFCSDPSLPHQAWAPGMEGRWGQAQVLLCVLILPLAYAMTSVYPPFTARQSVSVAMVKHHNQNNTGRKWFILLIRFHIIVHH